MSSAMTITMSSAHSPTFSSLHLRQLILQPFCRFTYVTAHSPTLQLLHLRHSSFSNPSAAYLRHSSFSNPSVASPTAQLILQPFFRFSSVTSSSLNSPVGLSFKGILFSKIFYMFNVIYVKSNSISCEFPGLKYVATLERKRRDLYDYV